MFSPLGTQQLSAKFTFTGKSRGAEHDDLLAFGTAEDGEGRLRHLMHARLLMPIARQRLILSGGDRGCDAEPRDWAMSEALRGGITRSLCL